MVPVSAVCAMRARRCGPRTGPRPLRRDRSSSQCSGITKSGCSRGSSIATAPMPAPLRWRMSSVICSRISRGMMHSTQFEFLHHELQVCGAAVDRGEQHVAAVGLDELLDLLDRGKERGTVRAAGVGHTGSLPSTGSTSSAVRRNASAPSAAVAPPFDHCNIDAVHHVTERLDHHCAVRHRGVADRMVDDVAVDRAHRDPAHLHRRLGRVERAHHRAGQLVGCAPSTR